MANYRIHWLAAVFAAAFLIPATQSAPLGVVDTGTAIAQAVAAASTSNTSPNVSVVLHSPILVPAMTFPDGSFSNTSTANPLDASTAETEPPRQALAPEMFNGGFALVNGIPVFLHMASQEAVGQHSDSVTSAVSTTAAVRKSTKKRSKETAQEKDSASIAHSVMKAMENLNNISQLQQAQTVPVSSSINPGPTVAAPAGNTSSVSVVVVPIIQNAFDLVDDRNPSTAQLAAEHPMVFSQKNGSHTTLHVVVKREENEHLPIGKHNAHGLLTSADFLGGGLINSAGDNVTNSSHAISPSDNLSSRANSSRPLENAHGPLTDEDFTTTAPTLVHLPTDKIPVAQHPNDTIPLHNGAVKDMVTDNTVIHEVAVSPTTPAMNTEHAGTLINASIMFPNALLPANVEIVQHAPLFAVPPSPIFFFKVPTITPDQFEHGPVHENEPEEKSVVVQVNSTTTRSSILQAIDVATLPSAPRVPLDIVEPIGSRKPLTPGTFAFVPVQEKTNSTEVKLLRMEV